MENLLGKWKLETNVNFDEFLTYYQYNWVKRKVALASYIDLYIEKLEDNIYKRTIDSTFLKNEEMYYLDGESHVNSLGFAKIHSINNNILTSEVTGKGLEWKEEISIENDKLIINRTWTEKGSSEPQNSKQIFSKY